MFSRESLIYQELVSQRRDWLVGEHRIPRSSYTIQAPMVENSRDFRSVSKNSLML